MTLTAHVIETTTRSGGGFYPCVDNGFSIVNLETGLPETNARGNVRFFSSKAGAKRAIRKMQTA